MTSGCPGVPRGVSDGILDGGLDGLWGGGPSGRLVGRKEHHDPGDTDAVATLEHEAVSRDIGEIAGVLQEQLGQRMAAHLAGLTDAKQIGRYGRAGGPEPSGQTERRLREGYLVVQMIVAAYDAKTAKAWLFGTNSRLDDDAPIERLGSARSTEDFIAVKRAARQFANFAG